ncbi:MAG: sterol desaturase family protein [Candidatus Binataceae bacterium]
MRKDPLARELPGWLSVGLILGVVAVITWLEIKRPLRRQTQDRLRRNSRNLMVATLSAAAIRYAEKPVTNTLARLVHRKNFGLVKWMRLPVWLEVITAGILLDYTLYIWHVLTHKVDFLWRFHRVHHADLDLDWSTAVRFHFVEMVLSVPWRAAQIVLIGVSPLSLSVWQTATLAAIVFHHSNLELPIAIERRLCRVLMTPRMHGIHHSIVKAETDSNWSTILAFPDYLHGTFRLNVPQHEITIGVPAYVTDEQNIIELMVMPLDPPRVEGPRRTPGRENLACLAE